MAKSGDYEVGYKKPPKHTQFKKGQSGNPKGRPKGTQNLKTDLAEELGELICIREDGKPRRVSKQRAMLKAAVAKAIKGDNRSSAYVLNLAVKILLEEQVEAEPEELTATDLEVLEDFKASILAEASNKKASKKTARKTPTKRKTPKKKGE